MLLAIAAHFALAAVLPLIARRWGRAAFVVGALAPAATFAYAMTQAGRALGDEPPVETLAWAPRIGLEFTVRLDALSLLLVVLAAGVGALVLCYYAGYAQRGSAATGRDSALLTFFAGAMVGLVVADDVVSLYVFWEFTTVCSFLLVGGDGVAKRLRRSATQALLVTALGGLAMLLGLILLATAAGTYRISEIVAEPPSGGVVPAALLLVLLGAVTKSAQVPFHPWLPGAMVAPTPVSAYLHAAAMVKAGVYLVARFSPGFAEETVWWLPIVVLGLWTLVLGGFRALREHDLKTLLAYGTVSQLGFLLVLAGTGTWLAELAAAGLLLAHGLFKSTLFLTVGVVDKRTGTRDVRELSGLGRRWPVLATLASLAALSMAGVPPLLGFVGKEVALEALLDGGLREIVLLAGIALGSVFTVAYSLRFLNGAFATKSGVPPTPAAEPGIGLTATIAVPALASLVFGVAPGLVEPLFESYADGYPGQEPYELALWHGFTGPLLVTAVVLAAGYLAYRVTPTVTALGGRLPAALSAQRWYTGTVRGLDALAHAVTGRLQVGSLPLYIGVVLVTMVVVPGAGLLLEPSWPGTVRWFDEWLQLPLSVLVLVAAGTVVLARRRLTAVLLTGVVGYGIGALFIVDGGADLALAQFLVETLTLVVFVFVIRRFPSRFVEQRPYVRRDRWLKAGIATAGGVFVALLAFVFSGSRQPGMPEASTEYIQRAESATGASNVVNAIIVDFRAFDTVGEISVLAVAATGAASLVLAHVRRPRTSTRDEQEDGRGEDGSDESAEEVAR